MDLEIEERLERLCCECDLCLFKIHLSLSSLLSCPFSLFLNMGLSVFLAVSIACSLSSQSLPVFPSPFGIHLLSPHSLSLTLCLSLYHLCPCPCSIVILSPLRLFPLLIAPFFSSTLSYFSVHPSLCLFFSGGRAD